MLRHILGCLRLADLQTAEFHKLEVEHHSLVQKVDDLKSVKPSSANIIWPVASISHTADEMWTASSCYYRKIWFPLYI